METKILKVTLEFNDRINTVEGEEAEKWLSHGNTCATLAAIRNMNPFDSDPIKWNVKIKEQN